MSTKPKARILVVEDDAIVRVTISNLLYDEGYDVSTANDGFDALLHLQQAVPDLTTFGPEHASNVGIRVAVRRATQIPRDLGCGLQRGVRFQCYTRWSHS